MTITANKQDLTTEDLKDFVVINDFFLTENSDQKFYALLDDKKVIGCITYISGLAEYSHKVASILRLEVLKNYRCRGYGSGLVRLAIQDIFSQENVDSILLRPAKKAVKFYLRLGFEVVEDGDTMMVLKRKR